MRRVVISIDGPAASGKSSTAMWVAEDLGYRHIDSGALYRAITAARLREDDTGEWTEQSVLHAASRAALVPEGASFAATIDGALVHDEIRSGPVNDKVSLVARMPAIREWVNARVRDLAREHDVVVDGRDIGTAVFPDAQLKVFLMADPWERATRRLIQQLGRRPNEEEIAAETERLVQRDARDATQSVQAKDAVVIDTTYLTQAEQVARIVALARAVSHRQTDTSAIDFG